MEANNGIELTSENSNVTIKTPKRILHFSDGTLEEYSDSEQELEQAPVTAVVDTASMGWSQWLLYKAVNTGNTALSACDYVGEALASFLGITTPKYQYELDEYRRMQSERVSEENVNGWLNPTNSNAIAPQTTTPNLESNSAVNI